MRSFGPRTNGIYVFYINDIPYIGKDNDIQKLKRIKCHINDLKKNKHFNKEMQDEFNKSNSVYKYEILEEFYPPIDDDKLCELEQFYIKNLDSYNNGFNKTHGGKGGNGLKLSVKERQNRSERMLINNPSSKLTKDEFIKMVNLIIDGYNNTELSKLFDLNPRYISFIRHKKRHKVWFDELFPDYQPISGEKFRNSMGKISEDDVKKIYISYYRDNKQLADIYNLYPKISKASIRDVINQRTFKSITNNLI